jgi:hypothetical protein
VILPDGLRRQSLVRRLVLLAAGWSLAVLVVSSIVLVLLFEQAAIRRLDQSLAELNDNLLAGSTVGDNGEVIAPALTDERAVRAYSGKYWEIAEPGPNGRVLWWARSRSLWDSALTAPPNILRELAAKPGKSVAYDSHGPLGEPVRVLASQVQFPGRTTPVIFMAAEDRRPVDRDVRSFLAATAIVFAILGAGLLAAVVIQVRVGLRPLFALRREIAAVRRGRADRLSRSYPTELTPLADELNALMAHNQEVVERQRTHVGNLAHALKTPRSGTWSAGRPKPCVSRSTTIFAAPAPPPGCRDRGSAPRWRRCWTNWRAPWSASTTTRAW